MNVGAWILVLFAVAAAFMFLRLIRLYISILTYKAYWTRQYKKTPKSNAFVLVVIGDSIAQAIGASRVRNGVVGLLAKSIEQKIKRPVHVINLSVTGARVAAVLDKQLPQFEALNIKPDLFIVEAGANNVPRYDKQSFTKEYQQLLSKVPNSAIVVDIPYFGSGAEKTVQAMNKIVHSEAKKRKLDVASVHQSLFERKSRRNIGADFFHPNNRGYRAWYAGIWPVVEGRLP